MKIFNLFAKKEMPADGVLKNVEIDSKRTSKLGYFFLILMVWFGVWQGANLLSSIQSSLYEPQPLSSCFYNVQSRISNITSSAPYDLVKPYYTGYYESNCTYSQLEISQNFPAFYDQISTKLRQESDLKIKVQDLEYKISNATYNRDIDINTAKKDLETAKAELAIVSKDVTDAVKLKKYDIQAIEDGYNKSINVFNLEKFALSFVLVFPLFYLAYRKYFKEKDKNSEYAVIWAGVFAIFSLIFAWVILEFIYKIFPKEILAKIIEFFKEFGFLLVAFNWLSFILVPLFFGFLIYIIQKKFYNEKAVAIRAIKNGECPKCASKYDKAMNFCPVCAYQYKNKCTNCGEMRMIGANYCQSCGK